jgi:hypothetical protein
MTITESRERSGVGESPFQTFNLGALREGENRKTHLIPPWIICMDDSYIRNPFSIILGFKKHDFG